MIERTEALTSVDVNSAGARRHDGETDHDYALRVNSEAADTLARMLRLVNLGVLDLTRRRDGYSLWDESRGCTSEVE